MGKMVFGADYTHDFERRIYDVVSIDDYYRVINLLKDHNLRKLIQIIAHKEKPLDYVRLNMRKSKVMTKMMLDEIDKYGFLDIIHHGRYTYYRAKYNTFIFDVR